MKPPLTRATEPGFALALIRVAAIPVFLAAERLVDHPDANTRAFDPLLALAAGYAVVALAADVGRRPIATPGRLAIVDFVLMSALVASSGGPFSPMRHAFFVLPVGAALLLGPSRTALVATAAVVAYVLIALTYPEATGARRDALGFELTQGLLLAWLGGAATLLSNILSRRTSQVTALAESRGRLVAQALDAEDVARRRVAEALHDNALQNLLAARQLLGRGEPDDVALATHGLDQSVVQIREAVFDLHPYLLEQSGLRAALEAMVAKAGDRAGFAANVSVDPSAERMHDQVVFSIARELVANAAKHAHATRVDIAVRRTREGLSLVVADDGVGMDPDTVRGAPLRGHIGLASCRERCEAIGGTLSIDSVPGGPGTTVTVELPARR